MDLNALRAIFPDLAVIEINGDGAVICDLCGVDYTNRPDTGGLLFGHTAVCPACVWEMEESAKHYGETQYIVARCPPGKSFCRWILEDVRQ